MSCWNPDIIKRYGGHGPRYTSYPAASSFHEEITDQDYRDALADGNNAKRALSLYMHIPFCEHVCYYCACNRIVTGDKRIAEPYLETLLKEMTLKSALIDSQRPVVQMHWGGGTPTFFDDAQLTRLMHQTGRLFHLLDQDRGDYGIEVDPRTVTSSRLSLLRGLGFNRLSFGVQDLDPRVQQAVNRVQPFETILALFRSARDFGFRSINADLIYGLPWQSETSLARTLEQLGALDPDRISLYNYAHLPSRFKVQRQIDETTLPSPSEKLRMLTRAGSMLEEMGYQLIGMDHFAKPDDALAQAQRDGTLCRNFQGYSLHGDADLVGVGVSSISQLGTLYAQNARQIDDWQMSLNQARFPVRQGYRLDQDDELRRDLIMTLLCGMQLDLEQFGQHWQIDAANYFRAELDSLRPLLADGLVTFDGRLLQITEMGRLAARAVAMVFDRYQTPQTATRFSRII